MYDIKSKDHFKFWILEIKTKVIAFCYPRCNVNFSGSKTTTLVLFILAGIQLLRALLCIPHPR